MNNRQVIFTQRPSATPTADVFEFSQSPMPVPEAGEFVVQNHYIAMDPALVSRMRDEDNYVECVNPGDVMHAYAVAKVVTSENVDAPVGQWRLGRFDMQQYALCKSTGASNPISAELAKPSWFLGALGTTGATAYLSFTQICQAKVGDTVVISSGASSVGSLVAQLAKQAGCRVVAIVSTEQKARDVKRFGYDAAVSYRDKTVAQLGQGLAAVCPDGIDIYYDNTSGDISEALLDHYNIGARIAVVGRMAISHLSDTKADIGRRDNNVILSKRIKKQGFVLLDHMNEMGEALMALVGLLKSGELIVEEDILQGFDNIPNAFFRMLKGENQGKQLVQLVQ